MQGTGNVCLDYGLASLRPSAPSEMRHGVTSWQNYSGSTRAPLISYYENDSALSYGLIV